MRWLVRLLLRWPAFQRELKAEEERKREVWRQEMRKVFGSDAPV